MTEEEIKEEVILLLFRMIMEIVALAKIKKPQKRMWIKCKRMANLI